MQPNTWKYFSKHLKKKKKGNQTLTNILFFEKYFMGKKTFFIKTNEALMIDISSTAGPKLGKRRTIEIG